PSTLSNLNTALGLEVSIHFNNGRYIGCITAGNKSQLRREINHPMNWVQSSGIAWPSSFSNFTVTSNPEPWPGTLLGDGCVSFLAYQTDDQERFAFVLLENIVAGTQIRFTDEGWSGSRFYAGYLEEACIWTADTALTAGTIVSINHGGITGLEVSHGGLCGNLNVLDNTPGESGDQILAFQGNVFSPTFLTGLSSRQWYTSAQGASNEDRSLLPNTLGQGISAVGFTNQLQNGFYSGAVLSGTSTQLASSFNTSINWIRSNNVNWPNSFPAITVTQSIGCCVVPSPAFSFITSCIDTSVSFVNTTSGIDANTSFKWDINGDGLTDYTTSGNLTHTYPAPGTYTVHLTTNRGGCTDSFTQTILVGIAPSQPSITTSGPLTLCDGETVTLSAPPGFSGYNWSNGASSQSITVNQAGIYSVTVVSPDGCESPPAMATVSVGSSPPLPLISTNGPVSICDGDSVSLFAPAGFPGYTWSTGDSTSSITVHTGGNYSVSLISVEGCVGPAQDTTVIVESTPAMPTIIASGPTSFCEGETVQLLAQASVNMFSWSTGETSSNIMVNSSGIYSVFVTNTSGCESSSAELQVTVFDQPDPPFLSLLGESIICEGDSTKIFAPSGFAGYSWSTGDSSSSITVISSGTYTVHVLSAEGCASEPTDTTIQVLGYPMAATITQLADSNFLQASTVGTSYEWYLNGTLLPVTTRSIDASHYGGGAYSVIVNNGPCPSQISEPFDFAMTHMEEMLGINWKVFPNPSTGRFTLQGENHSGHPIQISVYNALGQQILPKTELVTSGNWDYVIDLDQHPVGVYMMKIEGSQQIIHSRLVIRR
ncbi:MAG: T9SS type A sorting domain-containing protein, partial [Bacteroidota bacterium]